LSIARGQFDLLVSRQAFRIGDHLSSRGHSFCLARMV
jgi:hypothetical protein